MPLEPSAPQRPLSWPPFVERLSEVVPDSERVYLVGGAVRDALRGRDIHDFDLATPDSGRNVARHIANKLGGKYYALDTERDVGRAIVPVEGRSTTLDVASFRGATLLEDLQGRDFTINAMMVRLDRLDDIIDPLGGQDDLFRTKVLRQCGPSSIADDPVRAFRGVRHSLQFGLHMDRSVLEAAKAARGDLFDGQGVPIQPERVRDELFKLLELTRPGAAFRILHQLGLLEPLGLLPAGGLLVIENGLAVTEALSNLIGVVGPHRDDNVASNLTLGTAAMVLDRFRSALQQHVTQRFPDDRQRASLLYAASIATPGSVDWRAWATTFSLSNPEKRLLSDLDAARTNLPGPGDATDRRMIYRYFKDIGEVGVDGVLLHLAEFLAVHRPTPRPVEWGNLLDKVASPLLDTFFNHHDEQVAPAPLLTGDELQRHFGLGPGPAIGHVLDQLLEEQAAGEIKTQEEALPFVKRLLDQQSS